jgi:hypothetical protein
LGERKGKSWLLPARGVTLEVKNVGVHRGQFTALVTLCLRALPLAGSTWYAKLPLNPNIYQNMNKGAFMPPDFYYTDVTYTLRIRGAYKAPCIVVISLKSICVLKYDPTLNLQRAEL